MITIYPIVSCVGKDKSWSLGDNVFCFHQCIVELIYMYFTLHFKKENHAFHRSITGIRFVVSCMYGNVVIALVTSCELVYNI